MTQQLNQRLIRAKDCLPLLTLTTCDWVRKSSLNEVVLQVFVVASDGGKEWDERFLLFLQEERDTFCCVWSMRRFWTKGCSRSDSLTRSFTLLSIASPFARQTIIRFGFIRS